jgi:protein-tyrosine-phosphatase
MAAEQPARCRVLFVCVGNSCRSQLAEAFARKLAADVIEPSSAGISPFGRIAETTTAVGAEFGLSFDGQFSKGLEAVDVAQSDLVVNMTGISSRGLFETAKPVVDWDIEDPFGEDLAVYRRIAGQIEMQVRALALSLRTSPPAAG